jgi:uncharacterized protein (DUF1015 family)
MATVRPFRGLRYRESAGALENLVAPPYDVLSAEERNAYAAKSPYNIVHLTLPEQKEDDRSKFVKYARSAAALAEWRREGALAEEQRPAFYRYTQTFTIPGTDQSFDRTALIALIKVEPYENGVVLPHEQTFPKHKEDRLRILEATRSHLECIFGLFEDDGGEVFARIREAGVEPAADVTTEDGVRHLLERIEEPEQVAELERALADKKVWIADGHHRYETALAFRQQLGERDGLVAEDFMMMALSSMSDPGLVLLPTHRIVQKMPVAGSELEGLFGRHFEVRTFPNSGLLDEIERVGTGGVRALGVALPGGNGLVLTLTDPAKAMEWIETGQSERLKTLDVSILHHLVFEKILGLKGLEFFSYTRDPQEALTAVETGSDAAFLMNPPTVEDMRQIALGGEKMPQKSTYYYPKILSGLAIWSLSDFE